MRFIFKISKGHFKFLDYRLRDKDINETKWDIWFRDQYKNPHETKHTIRAMNGWFRDEGFQFVKSFPKTNPFEGFSFEEKLFKPEPLVNNFMLSLIEAGMMFTASKNGGFFIIIGKRIN